MTIADIIVGSVAILLGLVALVAAARSEKAAYEPPPVRWIERRYGRAAARWCYGLLGVILIALGCVVFVGLTFPWQR